MTREFNDVYEFFLVLVTKDLAIDRELTTCDYLKNGTKCNSTNVFFDYGEGYKADQFATISGYRGTSAWEYNLNSIPHGCIKVRFDPPSTGSFFVNDFAAFYNNGEELNIYPLNGFYLSPYSILFHNVHAQMEALLPQDAKSLKFIFNIQPCFTYSAEKLISLKNYISEEKSKHSIEMMEMVQESQHLKSYISEQNREIERIKYNLDKAKISTGLASEEEKFADHVDENRILEERIAAISESNSILEQQVQIANYNYEKIINSQCWKATAPVRFVLDGVKQTTLVKTGNKVVNSIRIYGYRATLRKVKFHINNYINTRNNKLIELQQNDDTATSIQSIEDFFEYIEKNDGKVFIDDKEYGCNGKRVLIVSHELDITGAPIALEYMAISLMKQGYFPILISPNDGKLRQSLLDKKIPVVVYHNVYYDDFIKHSCSIFDAIIINTIVGAPLITMLNGGKTPVLWWIHEARASYHEGILSKMPNVLEPNIHVACVGSYAQKVLQDFRPQYITEQLLYYIPDCVSQEGDEYSGISIRDDLFVFITVGVLEERKGYDVLVESIRLLSDEQRRKCLFIVVGRKYNRDIYKSILALQNDYPDNFLYINEIPRDQLLKLYKKANCLICSSKDDPMPIVVTEAMAMGKTVICSENTGSAKIISDNNSGIIYKNNSPDELKKAILRVINDDVHTFSDNARNVFISHFSPEVFDKEINNTMIRMITKEDLPIDGKISVVIPTYNAGSHFQVLLESLTKQKKVPELEILIVDSGSSDKTVAIARQYNAEVIEIKQAEFSHSYARNLGANFASGKYILFMTQDAMPGSQNWLYNMAQPLLHNSAVAVSCREEPRDDSDLLGRFNIWTHSNYMNIIDDDIITSRPNDNNANDIRKNAQLNDVACLILSSVFKRYKYKGDYAEDLDLGIRLIRNGYHLALLGKSPVIHSHNRSAYYYTRRCFVDTKSLKKILVDIPIPKIEEMECCAQIVTGYAAAKKYSYEIGNRRLIIESSKDFFSWTNSFFTTINKELKSLDYDDIQEWINIQTQYDDNELKSLVNELLIIAGLDFTPSMSLVHAQKQRFTYELSDYLSYTGEEITPAMKASICEMVIKNFGQLTGITLASYSYFHDTEESCLNDCISDLGSGI